LELAADQITDEHVRVLQSPPKVTDGPVLISRHWHRALSGFPGSSLQMTSRQFAHGLLAGHVMTRVLLVTSWVENVEYTVLPRGARRRQELSPIE
jgi:hypothetical protein